MADKRTGDITMEWQEVKPQFWEYEKEGDSLEGVVIGREPSSEGYGNQYYVQTASGIVTVWGTAVIDARMKFIGDGETIKLVYAGEGKNKRGQRMHEFNIYRAKAATKAPAED